MADSASSDQGAFRYEESPYPIRSDLVDVNRRTWGRMARAGSWWTGEERVAIAAEVRNARDCALCTERKAALSPNAVQGIHDSDDRLSAAAIDAVHRLTTDHGRTTQDWVLSLKDQGVSDGHYVELLSVVGWVLNIDTLHEGLGLCVEPLPDPVPGEPDHRRPIGLVEGEAWVPMLHPRRSGSAEADLYVGLPQVPYVLRALSLVPDAVRALTDLEGAYYMPVAEVANLSSNGGRSLERRQIELIASRVSAFNECFY